MTLAARARSPRAIARADLARVAGAGTASSAGVTWWSTAEGFQADCDRRYGDHVPWPDGRGASCFLPAGQAPLYFADT